MRHTLILAGIAVGATVALAGPASAAVTFVGAELTASVRAGPSTPKSHTTTAGSLPSGSLDESLFGLAGPNEARVEASASLDDAYSGFVDYEKLYARGLGVGVPASGQSGFSEATAAFTYNFTVDQSYFARFTYDVSVDPGASFAYVIYPTGQYSSANSQSFSNGAGELVSAAFGPGAYTLKIYAGATALSYPGDPTKSQTTAGSVSFLLLPNGRPNSPAPEPAAWALLIAGFGLAGAELRRRHGLVLS